ncbi:MAG: hypothetical protein M1825_004607 [Sarcosagium campestre]|nr:MAG: hypothetical protein M1825_004607 [Sarcosagium campestre]
MPGLVHKLVVHVQSDKLILQPTQQRTSRVASVAIRFKGHEISTQRDDAPYDQKSSTGLESYGVVGLLSVETLAYLILITRRDLVAYIRGKPVYVIADVGIIPLQSEDEAQDAVSRLRATLKKQAKSDSSESPSNSDSSDSEGDQLITSDDERHDSDPGDPASATGDSTPTQNTDSQSRERRTSIAEDVIGRRGVYGRFATNWFSARGWSSAQSRPLPSSPAITTTQGPRVLGQTKAEPTQADNDSTAKDSSSVESGESPLEAVETFDGVFSRRSSRLKPGLEADNVTSTLLPKLLRTTKMLFSSRSFFFSYDIDLTRSLMSAHPTVTDLPLHKTVDSTYFWNRFIQLPFIDGHHDQFVIPLLQGFVGQRTFSLKKGDGTGQDIVASADDDVGEAIELQEASSGAKGSSAEKEEPDKAFVLTLISRRSIERAGLRYLRRGVDDKGHTANSVETEQILSSPDWRSGKTYSAVQIRGSIPLYFSQSPYSFKPLAQMHQSAETNLAAFKKHFENVSSRYGEVQAASLLDKHGNELKLGEIYEETMSKINSTGGVNGKPVGFEWFDFHSVCKGMKFENVSILMDTLGTTLERFGSSVEDAVSLTRSRQRGVLRTNCMDCLDRSNVVQSAVGRRMLEKQLEQEGYNLDVQADKTTQWFNTLWADNGDAISRQYTSTAALKGDFTRTRKRDYRGALNDLGLTLSRYFNNIVNDYFSQAAIDYLLGNVNAAVFEEFEANMMSGDPAMSLRKVRQNAIDTSIKMVLGDGARKTRSMDGDGDGGNGDGKGAEEEGEKVGGNEEELSGAWNFLSPATENTLRTFPLAEVILLLTPLALYCVRFDWDLEKVSSFTRINLRHIVSITYGTYVTSTLAVAQTNEARNVGFVISYRPGSGDFARVNTGALLRPPGEAVKDSSTSTGLDTTVAATAATTPTKTLLSPPPPTTRFIAFKALNARYPLVQDGRHSDDVTSSASAPVSERDAVRLVCEEVERAALAASLHVHDDNDDHNDNGIRPRVPAGSESTLGGSTSEAKPTGKNDDAGIRDQESKRLLEEGDIISLAQARKKTGLVERLGYEIKKLVWA